MKNSQAESFTNSQKANFGSYSNYRQTAANKNHTPNNNPRVINIKKKPATTSGQFTETKQTGIEAQAAANINRRRMVKGDIAVEGFAGEQDYRPTYKERVERNKQAVAESKIQKKPKKLVRASGSKNPLKLGGLRQTASNTYRKAFKFIKGISATIWAITFICAPIYALQLSLWALSIGMLAVGAGFAGSIGLLTAPITAFASFLSAAADFVGAEGAAGYFDNIGASVEALANLGFFGLFIVFLLIFVLSIIQTILLSGVFVISRVKAFDNGLWIGSWILTALYIIPIVNIFPWIGLWLIKINLNNTQKLANSVRK